MRFFVLGAGVKVNFKVTQKSQTRFTLQFIQRRLMASIWSHYPVHRPAHQAARWAMNQGNMSRLVVPPMRARR
jgi:hypothetical protein